MTVNTAIIYPQYRKYHNEHSYFKIISPDKFIELKKQGMNYVKYEFEAKILPDKNFIYDLTFDYKKYCLAISEAEYNLVDARSVMSV